MPTRFQLSAFLGKLKQIILLEDKMKLFAKIGLQEILVFFDVTKNSLSFGCIEKSSYQSNSFYQLKKLNERKITK